MKKKDIKDILKERILILDGALGTMVQASGISEEDYSGSRFSNWSVPLKGCNDVLVLTSPQTIRDIHEAYLRAGADIITTDTFNATSISLSDYQLQDYAYEINKTAASLAREAADQYTMRNPSKPRFVAGSVGPTSSTASMSADIADPGSRQITFDQLKDAYTEQIRGLIDGGADILLIETVFDTLNAKAALFAIELERQNCGYDIPVMISGTLGDASGRILSGQVVEAFYTSIKHARPLSVGFNCAFGAKQLRPYLSELSEICRFPVSVHPNAGLPNVLGGYDETAEMMAADVETFMREGLVNIVGGCCGTTPSHIAAIARLASKYVPREVPADDHETVLSGLEPLHINTQTNFVNIGERANVAGSAKFARLIRENNYEEAISIVRHQVEAGAQIVDVCMDDGLIDGVSAMERFLFLSMSEPEIARVPVMVDSSSWSVLEAGLKCVQGKCIVNSISLKEGEGEFLRLANLVRAYGAATVVMLFDEKGQADTYERKIEIAQRAYNLLIENEFPPEDIVFDPNVLAVATGIEQHDNYGKDFIDACRWIKNNLPYAKVSGGVSNLSFAFRGNNTVREAMHSVFLFHAIEAGMDMGIVNPALLQVYSDIEPELLELAEDVVLNRRPDATERLSVYAERVKGEKGAPGAATAVQEWRNGTYAERINYAMKKGITDYISEDILEAYKEIGTPLKVIDNTLMPAMSEIGELFGAGKMFLPQVVKSARVMKQAVSVLEPYIEQGSATSSSGAGSVLIATVKGDVHDIGKNIVSVVMACNGYRVHDLGVMVDTLTIADQAEAVQAEVIGLSGLISPSLDEMIKVVQELERRGVAVPVIIGGATTSELHTAVKIAPHYSGAVIHSRDASENIAILSKLFGEGREAYIASVKQKQEELSAGYHGNVNSAATLSLSEARSKRYVKQPDDVRIPSSISTETYIDFPIEEVVEYIDWNFFFPAWEIKGKYPEIFQDPHKGEQAKRLFEDAQKMLGEIRDQKLLKLNAVVGLFPAHAVGDDIFITDRDGSQRKLAQLRSQRADGDGQCLSLADYVVEQKSGKDYVALFALTGGLGLDKLTEKYRRQNDDYSAIMYKLLADRLTEAFAEVLHLKVRQELWGYEKSGCSSVADILGGRYEGIRVAFGYPSSPDHSMKEDVFDILDAERLTGMSITENYMIRPGEAICGMMFAGPGQKFFSIGKIDDEQIKDYAERRGMPQEEVRRLLPQHIR